MIGRLAIAALLVLAPAQQAARDTHVDVAPSGSASIAGVVVDQDQKLVRRASIRLTGAAPFARSVVTDDSGRFVVVGLPAGRYTLIARKAGYPQMSYGAKQPFRTGSGVVVADGQALTGLKLTLGKGAVIEGTVFDDRGERKPGVPVQAWEIRTSLGGDRVFSSPRIDSRNFVTDDRGMYRIYGLPPGEYTVGTAWYYSPSDLRLPNDDEIRAAFAATQAVGAGVTGGRGATLAPRPPPTVAYTPVYHPDSIDPLAARTVALDYGDERTGIDLRMQLRPMARVEATIVEEDGSPAKGFEIALERRSPVAALNTTTVTFSGGSDYRSESLPQGDYGLIATAAATGDRPGRSAAVPITISGPDPVKLTITLRPQPPITGRLVFTGDTLPRPDLTTVSVGLGSAPGGSSGPRRSSSRSSINADGILTITGATAGRYVVVSTVPNQPASGPNAWTLLSVLVDGRDVTDLPVDIADAAPPTLTLTYTDQVSELSGRLVHPSGQPGTDFFVVVVPADRQYWAPFSRRIVSVRPDTNGRYTIRGLPPGSYQIAVTTELDAEDLRDATALEKLTAMSVPLTLGLGEKKTFDIKLGIGG